ncbi:MAG TPA: GH92 family glycosyl hydrolase [Pyrinomonadaceae bacterium]|nr:GH92 family glycosyl hydrolase [Pyrinomonadaceae bacterium]
MRNLLASIVLISIAAIANSQSRPNYVQYVNPLIGTRKMGHTYPGATVPFGSVQLSPDTDEEPFLIGGKYNKETYRYCAGYQFDDPTIVGFSHTHFSGTGHSDLGDILIMPTQGVLQLEPGSADDPKSGFRSAFSHGNERAEADYYRVKLEDDDILAEMTATTRVGFHRYTFNRTGPRHIVLDLKHGIYDYDGKNVRTFVRVENDRTITGFRETTGWARTRTVYFALQFSKPFESYGYKDFDPSPYRGFWRKFDQSKNFPEMIGKQVRAYFDFDSGNKDPIEVKVALSPVSTAGALANIKSEAPGWDFGAIKRAGQKAWNDELGKIDAKIDDPNEMVNFYTAMYHAFLSPTVYMDADGQYKGLDQNNHRAAGFTNYTTFSLWDTYRALHPFFNIVQPRRNRDMIRSMIGHYDQSVHKMLPVWSHYANENWCMIGYHSVSVVSDAIVSGNLTGPEANKALDAMAQTARTKYYDGLGDYMRIGYVPVENNGSSVSKTLEYAYDDYAIAQAAKKLGRKDVADEFAKRAGNWRNVFDPSTGFMRPKSADGKFLAEFDPMKTEGQGFIEGNSWNYSLYVPHDPAAMIEMMGGKSKFAAHLDELFNMHLPDEFFAETEDITREGIIGGYVHGNEPSHHVAYLYNWTDAPWKTQERVRMILKHQYKAAPDGLGGNDDCGQMSAWYLFTALGFYPVAPGSGEYQLGSPAVSSAVIRLENGRTLRIEAVNQSDKNVYVDRVELNGKRVGRTFITYPEIAGGGTLKFFMSSAVDGRQ